ncbi:DNA ligase 3 [Achroia grisella]|uniref:DNA ligase 3 n=1 Tax=Achroia grisella TaxID=688607 RepID=UPI0027D24D6F|nr:DNA ligase 3 [Achroia grisella]
MADFTPFYVDRAKGGRASCKVCKGNCQTGELRFAKIVASPYGENQQMKSWHHVDCFMTALLKQRPATKRIDSIDDIGNWDSVTKEDQKFLLKKINEMEKLYAEKNSGKYTAKVIKNESKAPQISTDTTDITNTKALQTQSIKTNDNMFSTFFNLCKKISKVDAYTEKTAVVNNFFRKGTDNNLFNGDLLLWCKLLLPQVTKRVYNLKSKQIIKLFSKIFSTDHYDMLIDLEQGDVAQTVQNFFTKANSVIPAHESTLTIHDVENFLEDLSKLTKEEEQIYHFKKIVKKCTQDDILMLIRLIKGDLRINAGPKHILEGVHPDAYKAFQTSRDLSMVLDRVLSNTTGVKHKDSSHDNVRAKIILMTPVLPMLAEACKSVEMAMKKCPNGMFSEIKYDGERVQVHKKGNEFKYFSRALKPVMPHKISHFKDYLPQAFPEAVDLILDAEVLMVDTNTGKPLPFGTLGIHKQSKFKDAQVCLFVFDCLYYNDKVLIDLPIRKRRQFLIDNMVEVKNHVMISEQQHIEKAADLATMIAEVLQLGLEGLVLKDLESTYEPGKRHWLKVKKDYLFDGAMADTADLVVLGAWFGSGKKGGMMSVFLMGCFDELRDRWVTVTKVHTGHDDSTLERLQVQLEPLMLKISQDNTRIPSWLDCNKGLVPDFVAKDPKKQPVWEITGTEFTKANIHTADGISIRFPRVTRIRKDKDWTTATNLKELKHLYKTSKEKTDVTLLNNLAVTASQNSVSPKNKIKDSPKANKIDKFLTKQDKTSPVKKKFQKDDSNTTITSIKSESSFEETECAQTFSNSNTTPKKRMNQSDIKEEMISPFKKKKRNKNTLDVSDECDNNINCDDVDSKKDIKIQLLPDNPLPDVFKDKRLGFYPDFISFPEDERKHFERHWIAYGGIVDKSIRNMKADFVVHINDEISFKKMTKLKRNLPDHVRHVNKNWLIRCINDIKLCDVINYTVTVKP